VAVAAAGTGSLTVGVAFPAQELSDFGLDRGLDEQAHAEASDLLQDVGQVAVGGEEVVDVGADCASRGILGWTRVWVPFSACKASRGPTPVVYLHRVPDATAAG
jgi:hypothetical protein